MDVNEITFSFTESFTATKISLENQKILDSSDQYDKPAPLLSFI